MSPRRRSLPSGLVGADEASGFRRREERQVDVVADLLEHDFYRHADLDVVLVDVHQVGGEPDVGLLVDGDPCDDVVLATRDPLLLVHRERGDGRAPAHHLGGKIPSRGRQDRQVKGDARTSAVAAAEQAQPSRRRRWSRRSGSPGRGGASA